MRNNGQRRVSQHINRRPAVNFHHAARYSEVIGLPLNRLVTINFTCAGCDPDGAAQFLQKMIAQRFAPWLRRTASAKIEIPPTYVWVLEAAGGQMAAHMLIHMPDKLMREFESRLAQWLRRLLELERVDGSVLHIENIYNLIGVRRYLLKGVDPAWANHLAVRPLSQGTVIGKRSGFSRNLGPTARTRGGYRPRRKPFLT